MTRSVAVYRSSRVADMYLFVDAGEGVARVPAALMQRFGRPVEALTMELTVDRKLARASASEVLAAIARQGFYLQLPPGPELWRDGRADDGD